MTVHPALRKILRPLAAVLTIALLSGASGVRAWAASDGPARNNRYALHWKPRKRLPNLGLAWPAGKTRSTARQRAYTKKTVRRRTALEDDAFAPSAPVSAADAVCIHLAGALPRQERWSHRLRDPLRDKTTGLKDTSFVGANDGAATTGLLIEMANHLRGPKLEGYSVWLVFFDGEEAIKSWSRSDSTYGSRHLAAKWQNDGTLKRIKAFILADMIGDRDLDIQRDTFSTPWLLDLIKQAATKYGYQSHFFTNETGVEDDHLAFVQRGVPVADVIDIDYGPNNSLASHCRGHHG